MSWILALWFSYYPAHHPHSIGPERRPVTHEVRR